MQSEAEPRLPVPRPTRISAAFWAAAREERLVLQHCANCDLYLFYPRPFCTSCLSEKLDLRDASGHASVHTFTIVRRAASPAFKDRVPYVLAVVNLEEGPRMTTNIVKCTPESVTVGMPVRAVYERISEDITLIKFEPDDTQEGPTANRKEHRPRGKGQ